MSTLCEGGGIVNLLSSGGNLIISNVKGTEESQ